MKTTRPDQTGEPLLLTEFQTTRGVELSRDERGALALLFPKELLPKKRVPKIAIAPTEGEDGCYDLNPGSWIGAIQVGRYSIVIRPKIPIDSVLFLISYAIDPDRWHPTADFQFAPQENLVEAIIPGFVAQMRRAFQRGVLQGYRTVEEPLQTVRGRIRIDDQVKKRYGIMPPIEVRYDEFTPDITENRLIKAAIDRLGWLRFRSDRTRRLLREFDSLLETVQLAPFDPRQLPDVHYTRLNQHYRRAVELAKLILRSTAFDLNHGDVQASAFLVDMNEVFENFVVVALREELGLNERSFPQGNKGHQLRLDEGRKVRLEPDLSWWDGKRCTFVGDVKYKSISDVRFKHADLYQLLAYTVAADLPGGILIYAKGESEPETYRVVTLAKELQVTNLDLDGSREQILDQVRSLADRVRRLRRQALAAFKSAPATAVDR